MNNMIHICISFHNFFLLSATVMNVFKYFSRLDDGGQGTTSDSSKFFFWFLLFLASNPNKFPKKDLISRTNNIAKIENGHFLIFRRPAYLSADPVCNKSNTILFCLF